MAKASDIEMKTEDAGQKVPVSNMMKNPNAKFSWNPGFQQAEVPEAVKNHPKRCHIDQCLEISGTKRCRWSNNKCRF